MHSPVNPAKHVQCKPCAGPTGGMYDESTHTVTICENHAYSEKNVGNVLTHELIHA